MVSWSALSRNFSLNLIKNANKTPLIIQNVNFSIGNALKSDHRTLAIQPSRFQWHKFKDMLHYYFMVGMIPVTVIIFYTNVFIGPAQLTPIPDDYEPKYWEYYRHPITRFIARYLHNNPQEDYEKFMHFIDEDRQKSKLLALERDIKSKMAERQDYQAFYYKPMVNKYLRYNKQAGDNIDNRLGENYKD